MNIHKLEVIYKIKFLGLLLDYNLNLGNHFEGILNSSKGLYVKLLSLKSKNFKLTPSTIINLYKTFIRSSNQIWKSSYLFLKQIQSY